MRSGIGRRVAALPAALALACALSAGAVTLGQVDDFEDGSLEDWGGAGTLTNELGGPAGVDDNYLNLDPVLFVGTFNLVEWAGDYVAEGITRVRFDVINAGPEPVSLRVMVLTAGCAFGGTACTAWTSTDAEVMPAGSGWVTVEFSLAGADMTQVIGSDSLADTLANVERLLIRHDPGGPSAPGAGSSVVVDAVVGFDNISALPEPATASALGAGGLLVLGLARRRRRLAARG